MMDEDSENFENMGDNLEAFKNSKRHTKGQKSINDDSYNNLIKPKTHNYLTLGQ